MPAKTKKEPVPTKTKKEPVKKNASAKVKTKVKKAPAKKTKAKSSAPVLAVMVHEHEETQEQEAPITPVEKIIHRFEKRFVFVPSCHNCEHMPMRINRLVALMTVLVAVLSGLVIAQTQSVDLTQLLFALAHSS
ncbi:hypothetical protein FJZ23_00505 [Candidatus Parcubacteria bacterium]|nr:hypothetical protein [Candidatus Parcubacteria bacterium]